MLTQGFLLGAAVYTTYAYSNDVINQFHEKSDFVFKDLRKAIDSGNIQIYLKGEIAHAGFKRLN